jgi:hypothetical protein
LFVVSLPFLMLLKKMVRYGSPSKLNLQMYKSKIMPKRKRSDEVKARAAPKVNKNPRIEKHCEKCEKNTTHSIERPEHKPRCNECAKIRQSNFREEFSNKPATKKCKHHPQNTHRGVNGEHCGSCKVVRSMVHSHKINDKSKDLHTDNPVTKEFINSLQGDLCDVCLEPCFVLYEPGVSRNPWCLSVGRRETGTSHESDRNVVTAQHFLCNTWKFNHSDEVMEQRLASGAAFVVSGCRIDPDLPNATIPNYRTPNTQPFPLAVYSNKISNCIRKCKYFDKENLTLEWFIAQFEEVQKGFCLCCGAPLGDDISFDRIDSEKEYVLRNVQLLHRSCNCGKGENHMSEVHLMFLKAYQNRNRGDFEELE